MSNEAACSICGHYPCARDIPCEFRVTFADSSREPYQWDGQQRDPLVREDYKNYCGPRAYSKILGVSREEAAEDLTLATLYIGEPPPVDGTYDAAMTKALKQAGVKIVTTLMPERPEDEWVTRGMPVNFGYGWGDYREDAYVERRYTLSQWLRLPEAANGLYLLVVGSSGNSHYVVVEDGEVTEGHLNYGSINRRRVNWAHLLERSGS